MGDSVPKHIRADPVDSYSPRSERLDNLTDPLQRESSEMERPHSARPSSCLPMQLFRVELRSFLPNGERNGGHLSVQGETRHRRPYPFLYQSTIEIAEWSRPSTGR